MDRVPRFVAPCRWTAMHLDHLTRLVVVRALRQFVSGYPSIER
jgi:hypothetical protein